MKENDTIVLFTDLDQTECLRRLRAAVNEERGSFFSWSGFAGVKEMIGKFDAQGFRVTYRRISRYASTLPHFCGKLSQEKHRTRIEGRFVVSQGGMAYMRFWQVLLSGVGVVFLFAA